jgi:hypothetical protein
MHLQAFGHWICQILFILVLHCCNLVVPDQLRILLLTHHELVIVQSTFICDLLRNELRMVSSRDALVNHLLLIAARQ